MGELFDDIISRVADGLMDFRTANTVSRVLFGMDIYDTAMALSQQKDTKGKMAVGAMAAHGAVDPVNRVNQIVGAVDELLPRPSANMPNYDPATILPEPQRDLPQDVTQVARREKSPLDAVKEAAQSPYATDTLYAASGGPPSGIFGVPWIPGKAGMALPFLDALLISRKGVMGEGDDLLTHEMGHVADYRGLYDDLKDRHASVQGQESFASAFNLAMSLVRRGVTDGEIDQDISERPEMAAYMEAVKEIMARVRSKLDE